MDLHAWITQQVDAVEEAARSELIGRKVVIYPNDGSRAITGTVAEVDQSAEGLELTVTGREAASFDSRLAPLESATAALRRCEADRRILARHKVDPECAGDPMYATACEGCGRWGEFEYPETENLNDCPELLDLAHAHGLTDEILAGLDRPEPPARPRNRNQLGLADILAVPAHTPTSDIPETLRGPRWGSRA